MTQWTARRTRMQPVLHWLASVETSAIFALSYLPFNALRIALLRIAGATLGSDVGVAHGLQVRTARRLTIGSHVQIGEDVILDARGGLVVGDHVSINSRVQVWSADHDWRAPDFRYRKRQVRIGHRCWLSSAAIVLPGSRVGDGTVIGAGAVVSGEFPEWKLVIGNPARIVADRPEASYTFDVRAGRLRLW